MQNKKQHKRDTKARHREQRIGSTVSLTLSLLPPHTQPVRPLLPLTRHLFRRQNKESSQSMSHDLVTESTVESGVQESDYEDQKHASHSKTQE